MLNPLQFAQQAGQTIQTVPMGQNPYQYQAQLAEAQRQQQMAEQLAQLRPTDNAYGAIANLVNMWSAGRLQKKANQGIDEALAQAYQREQQEALEKQREEAERAERERRQAIEDYKKRKEIDAQFAQPDQTSLARNLIAAGYQPGTPEFMQAMKDQLSKPGQTINLGPQGTDYGNPPTDMAWVRDANGRVKLDERGVPQAAPISGTKLYRSGEEESGKEAKRRESQTRTGDIVAEDVGRLVNMIEKADFPVTGFGSLLSKVPGSRARDVAGLIDTVRANVGFDKLQAMREASPTGGALGQVSDLENRLMQATIGNLEQSQSKEQLLYNLNRVRDTYLDIIHGPGNRPEETPTGAPEITATGPNGEKLVLRNGQWVPR